MNGVEGLRALGGDALSALLELRPDVLHPVAPRSLLELSARFDHPRSVRFALRRLDRPALQAAEALAALALVRPTPTREELERLLGVHGDAPARVAVDRALDVLRRHLLADQAGGPTPGLLQAWAAPLGLENGLTAVLPQLTVEHLRSVLSVWQSPTGGRKSDLCHRLQALLGDPDRVRAMVDLAPAGVAEQLRAAARDGAALGGGHRRYSGYPARSRLSLDWALDRLLVVRTSWEGESRLVADVALALLGHGWAAPFDWVPPPLSWAAVDAGRVEGEAGAAAGHALRVADDLLRHAGRTPVALLKDNALGVRELRRVAKVLRCTPGEVRLVVALCQAAGLLGYEDGALVPTRLVDHWIAAPPASRLAGLIDAWSVLGDVVLDQPEALWFPAIGDTASAVRWTCLLALRVMPAQAVADPRAMAQWAAWRVPLAGVAESTGSAPASARTARVAEALLVEAAWLGVTGSGALSSVGEALAEQGDVGAALSNVLGPVHQTARLQGDLTAVVLGQPSGPLTALLDSLATREAGSTAMDVAIHRREHPGGDGRR